MNNQIENKSTPPDAFALSKKVFELIDFIRAFLWFMLFTISWVFAYLLFYGAGWLENSTLRGIMIFLAVVITSLGLLTFRKSLNALGTLKNWKERYLITGYLTQFEFIPRKGDNIIKDVIQRLAQIYPEIEKSMENDPEIVELNAKVDGKESKYSFDGLLYLRNELFFIEQHNDGKMKLTDLQTLFGKIFDVMKHNKYDFSSLIIVSKEGFEDATIPYIEIKKNTLRGSQSIDFVALIRVIENGYQIVNIVRRGWY